MHGWQREEKQAGWFWLTWSWFHQWWWSQHCLQGSGDNWWWYMVHTRTWLLILLTPDDSCLWGKYYHAGGCRDLEGCLEITSLKQWKYIIWRHFFKQSEKYKKYWILICFVWQFCDFKVSEKKSKMCTYLCNKTANLR